MKRSVIDAPAKINIALDISGVREDGYHLLKMVNTEVPKLFDTLTVEAEDDGRKNVELICDCTGVPCDEKNTCFRAAKAFLDKTGKDFSVKISIAKRIPYESGLGGGSSDAAAVLKALDKIASTGMSMKELSDIGAKIGADVPFCVYGGTAKCSGIGEIVEPINVKNIFESYALLIVKPKFGISTVQAYKYYDELAGARPPEIDIDGVTEALTAGNIVSLGTCCGNILETIAVKSYPEIASIKSGLKRHGAYAAQMTGSGTAVFGIFDGGIESAKLESVARSIAIKTGCGMHIYVMTPHETACKVIIGQE